LIRAGSPHNTLLVTEQCDQACVMCSQPPKKDHLDLFRFFSVALLLAPKNMTIGLSGGEPTLHKASLFKLILDAHERRPDLSFHILSNGQHFSADDVDVLRSPAFKRVLWGIPLYSNVPSTHDAIVVKEGAFDRLARSLSLLSRAGSQIELRTVLVRENLDRLPSLAGFVCRNLPFVARWAIMQLENIGYARQNWDRIFVDHSLDFRPIGAALSIASTFDIDVRLFNFPLCTVPVAYRRYADPSISDWKRKYVDSCSQCSKKEECTGFFEWYKPEKGYRGVAPL
jgi:His-Xaa-Ser system radical SAM maturase HxsC